MTTFTRRFFVVAAGTAALASTRLAAQDSHDHHHGDDDDHGTSSCAGATATPVVVPYDSDIPFDLAYIDTMIPHHSSVVELAEVALDSLEDSRLVEIAQAVLDTQPGEMEQLLQFRNEWYPDEPEDISDERMHEMMMVTMAGGDMCGDEDHMDMMDGEWLVNEFEEAENKDLSFIDLVVPHHQMAVHQSMVGLELAEHEELRTFCEDVIKVQTEEIVALNEIREDISNS